MELDKKVVLITGASRGIGLSIARAVAERGARVVIASRKQENVDEALQALSDVGEVMGTTCHVGSGDDIERLVEFTVDRFGDPDVLINNAATNPHFGPTLDCSMEQWQKLFEVNLMAAIHSSRLCVPGMLRKGGGSIINVASVAGLRVYPGMGPYAVFKSALIMITRVLAAELGPEGIRVNAIAPGFVKTKFSEAVWSNPRLSQGIERQTPLRRMADPDEMAGIACYLASDASRFTTGTVQVVDGGLTL